MNILGVSGSPKKTGFTSLLLDKALEGAGARGAITEKIILNDLILKPCQECSGCSDDGICITDDEMHAVRAKFESADAVIIASPIFFGSVSAQLKAMIDRFHAVWVSKYILKKKAPYYKKRKGVFICVAGEDKIEYFANAKQVIKSFFATLDIEYTGELFFGGLNIKANEPHVKDAVLKKAFDLGTVLAVG